MLGREMRPLGRDAAQQAHETHARGDLARKDDVVDHEAARDRADARVKEVLPAAEEEALLVVALKDFAHERKRARGVLGDEPAHVGGKALEALERRKGRALARLALKAPKPGGLLERQVLHQLPAARREEAPRLLPVLEKARRGRREALERLPDHRQALGLGVHHSHVVSSSHCCCDVMRRASLFTGFPCARRAFRPAVPFFRACMRMFPNSLPQSRHICPTQETIDFSNDGFGGTVRRRSGRRK